MEKEKFDRYKSKETDNTYTQTLIERETEIFCVYLYKRERNKQTEAERERHRETQRKKRRNTERDRVKDKEKSIGRCIREDNLRYESENKRVGERKV